MKIRNNNSSRRILIFYNIAKLRRSYNNNNNNKKKGKIRINVFRTKSNMEFRFSSLLLQHESDTINI
jgi:hypothetical protein